MIKESKLLRERMTKVHSGQFLFFQTTQQVLPKLNEAVTELHDSMAVKDLALPEAKRALQKLADQIRAIEEAAELDRQAVAKVGAGLGKFMEESDSQRERMHEMAHLATLIQYFDVAAQGSVPFWVELLGMVDPAIYAEAWGKMPEEKRQLLSQSLQESDR